MRNVISFCSKINFVNSYEFFKNHQDGTYIDYHSDFINAADSADFYTSNVADCIAGGIVSPYKMSVGFHITGEYILPDQPFQISGKKPERALLIGSKKILISPHSVLNFDTMKNFLKKTARHLTYFQEHKPFFSASDIHYSLKDDTWTICTCYGLFSEIRKTKELFKVFRKIKIADGDRLFIKGQEIMPRDCPQIFEHA